MSRIKDLVAKRVETAARPCRVYAFVLDPRLHAEWIEASEALAALPAPQADDTGKPRPERQGGPRQALAARVADLEAQVAAVTGIAVFQALTADEREATAGVPGWNELPVPERARRLVRACFAYWEEDGQRVDDAGLDELEALLPHLSEGELYGISTPMAKLSTEQVDLPKSVKQYIESRNSATNSKPAANGA